MPRFGEPPLAGESSGGFIINIVLYPKPQPLHRKPKLKKLGEGLGFRARGQALTQKPPEGFAISVLPVEATKSSHFASSLSRVRFRI